MAVVGLAIRVYQLTRQTQTLRQDKQRLTLNSGEFDVDDFGKVYLRQLDCPVPLSCLMKLRG